MDFTDPDDVDYNYVRVDIAVRHGAISDTRGGYDSESSDDGDDPFDAENERLELVERYNCINNIKATRRQNVENVQNDRRANRGEIRKKYFPKW